MSNASENVKQQETALLFLHAQTSLHPGSGTALGTVDLPIQRERHTQWPTIPGSAIKGILRDACRENAKQNYEDEYDLERKLRRSRRQRANEEDAELVAAFGPGKIVDEGNSFAGALSVTDARILAYPVRSLRGVFAWVTCAAVLDRLSRDLRLVGETLLAQTPKLNHEQAACPANSPLLIDTDKLVLEEFEFRHTADSSVAADWIATHSVADEETTQRMRTYLVILNDDDFTHFVLNATEIVARIGLDYERKTVKAGALFYQECLPAETVFYSLVFANASRRDGGTDASGVMNYLRKNLPPVLQIGGDETTGKGICTARLNAVQERLK
jgi:CRISPR-associated protein Cmr4